MAISNAFLEPEVPPGESLPEDLRPVRHAVPRKAD